MLPCCNRSPESHSCIVVLIYIHYVCALSSFSMQGCGKWMLLLNASPIWLVLAHMPRFLQDGTLPNITDGGSESSVDNRKETLPSRLSARSIDAELSGTHAIFSTALHMH
ncbi:hypothetical protein BJX61DRAFT_43344 [Aspergillus egyptiacus]|nr:hypothetical protein BJX61DRAFT_43344 [Aspergillus egyptiacus]